MVLRGVSEHLYKCFFRQKRRPPFPEAPRKPAESDGFRSSPPPSPLSLSLLDAERLVAQKNARGGSDRARRGASACRIRRGRRAKLGECFLQMSAFALKKWASSGPKGSMSSRPGAERRKHRLLEPTFWPPPAGFTSAACGTHEYLAALHDAICGVRAPPQTPALVCPRAAHERTGRSRGTPPSQTTHPPHNIALAAGTLSHHCLHMSRRARCASSVEAR